MEAAVPSNRFQKLLAAFKIAKDKQDRDSSLAADREGFVTPDTNNNGACPSVSSEWTSEPSPSRDISMDTTTSDSWSKKREETSDISGVCEIVWDHTMSGSDQEDSDSEPDSESIDEALYDTWYSGSSTVHLYRDDSQHTGQTDYETIAGSEDDYNNNNYEVDEITSQWKEIAHSAGNVLPNEGSEGNNYSYEIDEIASQLKELAHSAGNVLYGWSCDMVTDEDRNKIYDQWMCDIESWERQRLLWLDERGKIEGFNVSWEDRTFLMRVDNGEPQRTICVRKDTDSDSSRLDEPLSEGESESEPLNLPLELTSVYEFTDRNLWRKYHKCFKEGKYSNN